MSPSPPHAVGPIGTDPDAFEVFYRAHLEGVRRFVARRVADPQLAADLTAEIFLAAIRSADAYSPDRGEPSSWLVGIARHVVAGEFRRQARDRDAVRRLAGRRPLDADSLARIEERIDAEREMRDVYAALAQLPERDRALLEMVAVDELTITEAAAVLGLDPGTARVRLHRARARIQSQFAPPVQEVLS